MAIAYVTAYFFLTNTKFSPIDNDFILSIIKVLIAKHLDASDTLNYEMLLKEKIKRLYTAFTSDYPLHIWLPTSTYTLQFLHHYLWPKLSRHWYNLQKSVFACQKYIWKAFKKRIFQYHSIFEYFVKICQTRQALKLLLIGGIFWTFYLAFAALLQCFMHQIYTWTFVRKI